MSRSWLFGTRCKRWRFLKSWRGHLDVVNSANAMILLNARHPDTNLQSSPAPRANDCSPPHVIEIVRCEFELGTGVAVAFAR